MTPVSIAAGFAPDAPGLFAGCAPFRRAGAQGPAGARSHKIFSGKHCAACAQRYVIDARHWVYIFTGGGTKNASTHVQGMEILQVRIDLA